MVHAQETPRKILHYPAPELRRKAAPVAKVDEWLRQLVADMQRVMKEEDGAGLAAPQVGESVRVFVTEAREEEGVPAAVYLNPVIESAEGELAIYNEGCLSLPGIRGDIRRPPKVTLSWMDLDGKRRTQSDEAMLARIWQHEMDHLDGVLIIDKMTPIDRLKARKPLKELKAAGP